jgi:hypothetical protein
MRWVNGGAAAVAIAAICVSLVSLQAARRLRLEFSEERLSLQKDLVGAQRQFQSLYALQLFELSLDIGVIQIDRSTGLGYTLSDTNFITDGLVLSGTVENISNPDMSTVTLLFAVVDILGWLNRNPSDGGSLDLERIPPRFDPLANAQSRSIERLPRGRSAEFRVVIPRVTPEMMKGKVIQVTPVNQRYEGYPKTP